MKNLLIFSDLHIEKDSLKECALILEEIGSIAKQYDCDTIFNLGDTFDGLHPTSDEFNAYATWIKRLDNINLIEIAANSHESESKESSIIDHYGILADNVEIVKEYKDENYLYCGHFGITECPMNYGAKISQKDLAQYKYVFLGHIHSFYQVKNVIGLGSVRYVSFSEVNDKKVVTIITDYKGPNEKLEFVELKSPIKMVQIELKANNSNELEQKIGQKDQNLPSKSPVEPLLKRKRGRPRKCPPVPISCQTQGENIENSRGKNKYAKV